MVCGPIIAWRIARKCRIRGRLRASEQFFGKRAQGPFIGAGRWYCRGFGCDVRPARKPHPEGIMDTRTLNAARRSATNYYRSTGPWGASLGSCAIRLERRFGTAITLRDRMECARFGSRRVARAMDAETAERGRTLPIRTLAEWWGDSRA